MDLKSVIGAVEHVADRSDLPGYTLVDGEGSRRRQMFLAADGKEMPNEIRVEATMKGDTELGKSGLVQSTFHITDKPIRIATVSL